MPFVSPKKSLSQNFLRDENIARKIVAAVNPTSEDVLVEIGSGHGVLTKYLYNRVKHFLAFEIDERVMEELKQQFSSPTSEFFLQDFLQTDLKKIFETYSSPLRVVGNIPYNITSPILFKMFDEQENIISDVTIMMQLDVAQRLIAKPRTKAYGILSVFAQYYCPDKSGLKLLFNVAPGCFYPKPTVQSAIVQLRFKKNKLNVHNEKIFRTTVRTAFGKRRKILSNALKYFPIEETLMKEFLLNTKIPLNVRPEELSVEDFVHLSNDISHFISEATPITES